MRPTSRGTGAFSRSLLLPWFALTLRLTSLTSAQQPGSPGSAPAPPPLKPVLPVDIFTSSEPGPFLPLVTHPTWQAVAVNVTYNPAPELLAPGYFFATPFGDRHWGPQIYANDGTLMFYGNDLVPGEEGDKPRGQDLAVCDFKGSIGDHLCFSQVTFEGAEHIMATHRVLDKTYKQVGQYKTIAGFGQPNPHEFRMLPGGYAFLQAIYKLRRADLTPFHGPADGYYFDGCFQEVDTTTAKETFHWCASDSFTIEQTMTFPNVPGNEGRSGAVAGQGDLDHPWDHDHINSIDKNSENDYLISLRHLTQVVKIAGRNSASGLAPGSIIWRMNGDVDSTVPSTIQVDPDARFSVQHCARFVNRTADEETIILFNNGWTGKNEVTGRVSAALILTVNNVTKTARLRQHYANPENRLSPAQGSAQLLDNKHVVVGWGGMAYHSEFLENGTVIYHAKASEGPGMINYRVPKHEWKGFPYWQPKLTAYCRRCFATVDRNKAPLVAYVSWNGATEVARWRFHVSFNSLRGPWLPAGTYEKRGFETQAYLSTGLIGQIGAFPAYVSVTALDANNKVLTTVDTETFVPKWAMDKSCSPANCSKLADFEYPTAQSRGGTCARTFTPLVVALVGLVLGVEAMQYFIMGFWSVLIRQNQRSTFASYGHRPADSLAGAEHALAPRKSSMDHRILT